MKKLTALLLSLALVCLTVLIAGCSKDGNNDTESDTPSTSGDESKETETETETETEAPAESGADADVKGEGVMTYAEYDAAALDSKVVVETYVQAKQSWWDNKATLYTQDKDGAYFIYNMAVSEDDYAKLTPGTKIKVTGYKSEWAGEVEITDAEFEILEGSYIAEPVDVTALLGTDELIKYQNRLVVFKGLTVEAYDENGAAFAYKNDTEKTDDLYYKVSLDGKTYDFCVEFYLCGQDTDAYKAVEGLKVGDKIDVTAYLYWYEGANPHTIAVAAAE